jgi:phage terminase large subunit-like protein
MPKRGPKGPNKSIEQHLIDGTYRADRHGSLVDLSLAFSAKPPHKTPAQRKRCQVPKKWLDTWKSRGVWTPNDDLAVERGCWFDERHAEHFRSFCKDCLSLWEGKQFAGQPFELMDWQWFDVFSRLFGWFRWDQEARGGKGAVVRRFDRAFVFVAKKNGKSPMAASVGAYFLAADGETGGKVLSAASARDQAAIVHGHAINMIQASPRLAERCKINRSSHLITFEHPDMFKYDDFGRQPANNAYKSISSEAGPQDGANANCVIADELHAWQGRRLWDILEFAFEARESPLFFMITTAGDDTQTVCYEQYEYAKDVASGHVKDIGLLPCICEAGKDDDIDDPAVWRKANPSMGITITESRFREMLQKARNTSSQAVANFKLKRLNIWGTVADPMIDPDAWDACYEPYTAESLFGGLCYGGLDLSKTMDMTAFACMFPGDAVIRQLVWFWLPEETFQKNRGRVSYEDWIDQGWLTLCPGNVIDYEMVTEKICWAADRYGFVSLRFDPYKSQVVVPALDKSGVMCIEFPQTITHYAEPTAEYQRAVSNATLKHNGNGCLTWQSRHVKCKTDANKNERPVKPVRGDIRTIDGIVAGIMALDGKLREPQPQASFYESETVEFV